MQNYPKIYHLKIVFEDNFLRLTVMVHLQKNEYFKNVTTFLQSISYNNVVYTRSYHWSIPSCITPQCHERYLLCTFVAQKIYTLVTRSYFRLIFEKFRLSSARVTFCEVHGNFKTTSQFLFNFCIILHCHDT